jgi:GNAT superfamily N-acetyltransferase
MIQRATVSEVMGAPEFDALIKEYARESAIEGLPEPLAKLESYQAIEHLGVIHVSRAEHEGRLIGFVTVAVPPSLHFSVPLAVTESFFVTKAHRGMVGLQLLASAEKIALDCGSPGLLVCAPLGGRLCELLPKAGYRPTNMVFYKGLGDVH